MEAFMLQDRVGLAPHIGLVKGEQKLIDVPRPELYNWKADRQEALDLAPKKVEDVVTLKTALDGLGFAPRDASAAMTLDPDVAMQLEALGYVQSTEQVQQGEVLEDAKDHANLIRWTQRAERHLQKGQFKEADVLLKKLSEQYPKLVKPKGSRIMALGQLGREDEAMALARESYAEHPDDANLTALLAGLLSRKGHWEEATKLYQQAADKMPWASQLRLQGVMNASRIKGQEPEALALAERYFKEEPDNQLLAGFIGLSYLGTNRVAEAMPLLEMGAKAPQPLAMVCFHLGAKAHQEGRFEEAQRYLLREIEHHPKNLLAFRLLKEVYGERQDWEGMEVLAQRALEQAVTEEWAHTKSQALFNLKKWKECRRSLNVAMKTFPDAAHLVLLDANLLDKEGKKDDAVRRFEEAKRMLEQKRNQETQKGR